MVGALGLLSLVTSSSSFSAVLVTGEGALSPMNGVFTSDLSPQRGGR